MDFGFADVFLSAKSFAVHRFKNDVGMRNSVADRFERGYTPPARKKIAAGACASRADFVITYSREVSRCRAGNANQGFTLRAEPMNLCRSLRAIAYLMAWCLFQSPIASG